MPFDFTRAGLKAQRQPGQAQQEVWRVGSQTVICGDCLGELKALPSTSVDVVITSPPYNIGIRYRSYEDRKPRATYLGWLREIGVELRRVLRPDGSFFLNVGSTNSDPWVAMDVAAAFRETFVLQNHITWVKSVSIGDDTVGHFKPITSDRYLNHNHEAVFHFTPHPIRTCFACIQRTCACSCGSVRRVLLRRCTDLQYAPPHHPVEMKPR